MGDSDKPMRTTSFAAPRSVMSNILQQDRSPSTLRKRSLSRIKIRRLSYGFTGVPGVRPIERSSTMAIEYKRPPLIYLPTFQLDPSTKFNLAEVQYVIDKTLDDEWTGHIYNEVESPSLAIKLAGDIMRKLKSCQYNRYRILSVVTIGQKRSQSYNNAIAFIWDFERDGYVEVHREVTTAFIQVTAFGVYLD